MSEMRTVDVVVTGRVQGVGYRYWTQRRAQALGLAGSVRNRADGSVAATFSGAPRAVSAMVAACETGPEGARVDEVIVTERGIETVSGGFEILDG